MAHRRIRRRHETPARFALLTAAALLLLALPRLLAAPEAPAIRQLTTDGAFKQHLSWSPDGGKIAYARHLAGQIAVWVIDADGANPHPITDGPPQYQPAWHPDGKRLAFVFVAISGTDGTLDIRTMAPDGKDVAPLVPPGSHLTEHPAWSPDGRRIAFSSARDGNREIYAADYNPAGSGSIGPLRRLTADPAEDGHPAWSPDGKRIVFHSNRDGTMDIYAMTDEGKEVRRLTDHPALDYNPAWSPDGKRVAFVSFRDGNYELYLMNADGSQLRNVTRHPAIDNYPAWHPNGRSLAFVSNRSGRFDMYILDLEAAE